MVHIIGIWTYIFAYLHKNYLFNIFICYSFICYTGNFALNVCVCIYKEIYIYTYVCARVCIYIKEKVKIREENKDSSILGHSNDQRSVFGSKDSTMIVHCCVKITVLKQQQGQYLQVT